MTEKNSHSSQSPIPPTPMNSNLNIHQRILGVMSELDYIEKGSARVNGQYRFVSHDQVTAKVHPLLVKYGITIIPGVEDLIQDGNRTTVKLIISFFNADNPVDHLSLRYIAHGIDGGGYDKDGREKAPGDKGPGKAISYAYKYALLKVFCLETGDDPDNDANVAYEPSKCTEFDDMLPDGFSTAERNKMKKFLAECSEITRKHVEDIKREAVKRMPDFMTAFKKWTPKKKDEV